MASNGEMPDRPLSEAEQILFDGIETGLTSPMDPVVAKQVANAQKSSELAAKRDVRTRNPYFRMGMIAALAVSGVVAAGGTVGYVRSHAAEPGTGVTSADIRAEALSNAVALLQTNTCAAELRVERDHLAANPRQGTAEFKVLYPPLHFYVSAIELAADVPCVSMDGAAKDYTLVYKNKSYSVTGGVTSKAPDGSITLLSQGSDTQDWCEDTIGMQPAGDVSVTYAADIAALQKLAATACPTE